MSAIVEAVLDPSMFLPCLTSVPVAELCAPSLVLMLQLYVAFFSVLMQS